MRELVCNTRATYQPLTGVQRYIREILRYTGHDMDLIGTSQQGMLGHLWEQTVLPTRLRGRLLWSPSTSGPIAVRNQTVTIHDLVHVEHPEWVTSRSGQWYRLMMPKLAPRVEHIIAISNFTRETIISNFGVPSERISVVYNGVEPRFSPRPTQEIEAARRKLAIPTPNYVLSLCSIEPRKNLRRLLMAWDAVVDQLPEDVSLVLSGMLGAAHRYPKHELGPIPKRVHFTGHVADELLPSLIAGASLFAYPSIYEGFGLPPLEAMACGVPVLTTNVTAMPEVAGDACRLVDPHDTDQMAQALLDIIGSTALRSQMSARSLARAKLFTWERTAKETMTVLRAVASQTTVPWTSPRELEA